jgi:hypothetical protein
MAAITSAPAAAFHWSPGAWYYVRTWYPLADWNMGEWIIGWNLHNALAGVSRDAWFCIFDAGGRLALFDNDENTMRAAMFQGPLA